MGLCPFVSALHRARCSFAFFPSSLQLAPTSLRSRPPPTNLKTQLEHEQPLEPSQLEGSEFYLREGERLAHMGSWSLRADGIFDYWSPETFVLFGFDPSERIPTLPKWLTVLHPDDRDLLAKTLERIFREGVRIDVTYRVDHPKQGKRSEERRVGKECRDGRSTQ